MTIFGVDIGGTGIKGAPVDPHKGALADDRFRIPTPHPAKPGAVADVVAEIVEHFKWDGPIGCTFPGVVQSGTIRTAANVDESWVDLDASALFQDRIGHPVGILNDADAAGLAEMHYGAGKGKKGVVLVTTFGTGIGTAVFTDGYLLPNTEFGHLAFEGTEAEKVASGRVKDTDDLSWDEWAGRAGAYLRELERLFWPDLMILGGGVSKKFEKSSEELGTRTPVKPAKLLNNAGIVGAALFAPEASA